MRRSRNTMCCIMLLGTVGSLTACGGDDSTGPGTSASLTSTQAQVVASALYAEMAKAMATATVTTKTSTTPVSAATMPSQTYTVNSTCTNGGTITGSYVYNTDLNTAGTGTVSGTMSTTAHGCRVSTGADLISTDGTLNFSYSVSYTAFTPSSNFTWHATGNFSWTGGSCAMDYTVSVSPQGHGTISGSMCGQSINQTV
jgi:hypothetical protein